MFVKVCEGHVMQTFDDDNSFVSQKFVASADVDFEDVEGNIIPSIPEHMYQAYHPYLMMSASDIKRVEDLENILSMIIKWAETPGNHGQNPYTIDFVKAAEKYFSDKLS